MSRLLLASGIHRAFPTPGGGRLDVLRGVDFELIRGELVVVTGESGVGKSTLLHVLGLLDAPTAGKLTVLGDEPTGDRSAARLRNQSIGFVFQFHHLLAEFSALENVCMPAWMHGGSEVEERAGELLREVGLAERIHHRPKELSGGERQRVAIARALMNSPEILLADEPTGNLDPETTTKVRKLFVERVRRREGAALVVTHDPSWGESADRVLHLEAGRLRPDR